MVKQTNWKVWHWPWHSVSFDTDFGGFYQHFAGIGPFQFHWFSNKAVW